MRRSAIADWYRPLGDYLAQQATSGHYHVVLPFVQIEIAILGRVLPHSARKGRRWWRNNGQSPHAWYGWLRAGWFVGAVSLAAETVTFTRGDDLVDETEQGEQRRVATAPELDGPTVVAS